MTYSRPLIDLLLRGFRWFEDGLLSQLDEAGWPEVTRAHSLVFAHLDQAGTRPSELAKRIGISRQAVNQTLGELVELGLVEIVPDPASRRSKLVVLTPAGKTTVGSAHAVFLELEDALGDRIGRTNVTELRRVLEADWGTPATRQ
ncbi:MAG: MarR family winged helix-turn-helix transcriptional regulator [Gaiellaceae bacterium]